MGRLVLALPLAFILAFVAALLAVEPQPGMLDEAGRLEGVRRATTALIRDEEIPSGLEVVGYTARDVPAPGRGGAQVAAPLSCAHARSARLSGS